MKKTGFFSLLFIFLCAGVWGEATFTWNGASGDNWDNPASWNCDDPAYDTFSYPGDGRDDDIVIINNFTGSITINEQINIQELSIENNSSLTINAAGAGKLTIEDFSVDSDSEASIVDSNDDIKITNKLTADGKVMINSGGGEISLKDIVGEGNVELNAGLGDVEITGTVGASGSSLDEVTVLGADITFGDNVYAANLTVTGVGTVEFDGNVHAAALTINGGTGLKQNKTIQSNVIIAADITALSEINITGGLTIDAGVSLSMGAHDLSASTLINGGTLDLGGAGLTVGALTNNGLIKLQGSQTVKINGLPPAVRIGGTIQYQGNTLSPWPFGYSYTNLTIDSSLTMGDAGALNISGTGVFNSVIKANSLTVGGSSAINANITTTGDQTYASITLATSITLNSTNGNITINQTGNLLIYSLQTGASGSIFITATGNVTQTNAITTSSLKVTAGTGITLTQTNEVSTSVDLTSTSGDIKFVNDSGDTGNFVVTVNTSGDIAITEESGGLNVNQITSGDNIELKADADIITKEITVSGVVKLDAGGDITVTDVAAYQLIAIAAGKVTVETVNINTLNTGRQKESAAIYIEADNFIVMPEITDSIVPGGTGGQLCLNLNKNWTNPNNVVNGVEDKSDALGSVPNARWHQYFINLFEKHLVYGSGTTPPSYDASTYIIVKNNNNKTKFELTPGYSVYISDAAVTDENTAGLLFKTSGVGTIKFIGTNKFTNLTLETKTDIYLENIATLGEITVETGAGKINFNQNITTTGAQDYKGEVTLDGDVTLTAAAGSVTFMSITGNGNSLTVTGNGVLNGGTGIENLSIIGNFSLVSGTLSAETIDVTGTSGIAGNIATAGNQTYTGEVTLDGNATLSSTAGLITLEHITGSGNSLTLTGDCVLNGGDNINILSVNGTVAINKDIAVTGTQTYSGTVTLGSTGNLITLEGTTVTLENIAGNGKSLTITGNGVLNGGSGIDELSVTGNFNLADGTLNAAKVDVTGTSAITGNIITTGTQEYLGAVTLGGDITLTSTAGSVTLGVITGNGKSLTIDCNGVLNGGTGINILSVGGDFSLAGGTLNAAEIDVSGISNITGNITTSGAQTYTDVVTLNGTGKLKIESQNGDIEFKSMLTSLNEIELSALSGNITITGKTTAEQLIAKAPSGIVSVNEITAASAGYEDEEAAIYIVANDFTVTITTPNSIIPGGTGGQLCLYLNKKWADAYGVVDGPEDTVPPGTVAGARWHQHFIILGKILYSFTEDSNGNGKLDRIRVQTNKELSGNFDRFEVSLEGGYKVTKFEFVNNNDDSFYIYLEEKAEFDGDKTPQWNITKNNSLIDSTGKLITDQSEMKYIDTIPPRIVYTLTLSGHPQTYVHISEPVAALSGGNISAGDISFSGSPATAVKEMDHGYLFDYSTPYTADDLAKLADIDSSVNSGGYFQMNNIFDKGKEPDKIDVNFPPKYPLDWGYTSYTDSGGLVPPNKLLGVMFNPNSDSARRVTDILVSLSPNNYFVWPVWAKPSNDNNSIMEFDGSKYLEKDPIEKSGIELQARISNNLAITPQLFWTTADIPANMRNPKEASGAKKVGGLWLPNVLTNPLYYYVPLSNGINTALVSNISPLFNYNIPANDLTNSGAKFEFIFRSSTASDLFIARLDAPPGVIPSGWYALIRPFSFDIQSMRYQRGGVTILNNVINSDKKEITYIRYNLPRSGRVTIQIYTLDGTLVKSIRRNEQREAGTYVDSWDGSNNGGRAVARGMYFVRVVGSDIDEIRKIMVVK